MREGGIKLRSLHFRYLDDDGQRLRVNQRLSFFSLPFSVKEKIFSPIQKVISIHLLTHSFFLPNFSLSSSFFPLYNFFLEEELLFRSSSLTCSLVFSTCGSSRDGSINKRAVPGFEDTFPRKDRRKNEVREKTILV